MFRKTKLTFFFNTIRILVFNITVQQTLYITVWKFQYFSIITILREIKFGESRFLKDLKRPFLPFMGL